MNAGYKLALLGCLCVGMPSGLIAQGVIAQIVPKSTEVSPTLRAGTPIILRILQGVSTRNKTAGINDRIYLEVAEAVTINDIPVIPVGSPAIGELTMVSNKGMWGKSGRIVGRVISVNVRGRTIPLTGSFDNKGGSGTVGAVAVSAIVFLPAGFFMTGKSAELPAGTTVRAFIGEDVPLNLVGNSVAGGVAALPVRAAGPPIEQVVPAEARHGPALAAYSPTYQDQVGPPKRPAKTKSGFCYDVPRGYAGTGSLSRPTTTSATPACYELLER